ncbi:hypothetical protein YQE_06786, partial [Dendroctonus ponderosae]
MTRHRDCHNPGYQKPQFPCEICGSVLSTLNSYRKHKKAHDTPKSLVICNVCGKSIVRDNFTIHLRRHTGEKPFQCDLCPAAFVRSSLLTEHIRTHTNEKPYECSYCKKRLQLLSESTEQTSPEKISSEAPEEISRVAVSVNCDTSNTKVLESPNEVKRLVDDKAGKIIIKQSHALVGQINLPCKLCSKVFFSTVPYKLHYFIVHSRLDNISYQCDLCDTLLNKEGAFISHVEGHFQSGKTHIKEGRPSKDVSRLTCEICAHILATTAALKEHRSKAHSLEDNGKLECPECKGTIDRKRLHAHIKLHQEEKASQSKSSTNGEDVSPNNDSLHKDAKIPPSIPIPGICERCRQTFPSRKSLKKHMRIHLNEKVSTLKSDFIHMREHLNATPSRKTDGLSSGQAQLPTQRKQPEKLQSKLSSSSGINPALLSSKSEGISNVHKCGACGKSVLSKRALKEHMRTHNSDVPSVVRKEFDHATFDRFERSQTSSEAFNIVRSLKPATSPRGNSTLKPFLTFKDSLLPCSKDQTFIQPWEPNRNPSIFPYTTSSNFTLKDQVLRQHSAGLPKDLMPDHERYFRDPSEINIELYSRRTSSSLSFIPPGEPLHRPPLEPESDRLNQRIGLQHFEAQETHQMFSRPRRIRPVSPYTKNYLNPIENSRVLSPEDNFGSLEVRRREPLLRTNFSNVPKPHESYREPSRFNDRQDSNYWNH